MGKKKKKRLQRQLEESQRQLAAARFELEYQKQRRKDDADMRKWEGRIGTAMAAIAATTPIPGASTAAKALAKAPRRIVETAEKHGMLSEEMADYFWQEAIKPYDP